MFTAASSGVAPNWNLPRCPSTGEWLNKLKYIHAMDYYSAIKSELFIHPTAWMNLQRITLSEKGQCQRLHTVWFHLSMKKTKL